MSTTEFNVGDRVIVARPRPLQRSLQGLDSVVVGVAPGVVSVALPSPPGQPKRYWPFPPECLDKVGEDGQLSLGIR